MERRNSLCQVFAPSLIKFSCTNFIKVFLLYRVQPQTLLSVSVNSTTKSRQAFFCPIGDDSFCMVTSVINHCRHRYSGLIPALQTGCCSHVPLIVPHSKNRSGFPKPPVRNNCFKCIESKICRPIFFADKQFERFTSPKHILQAS